MSTTISDLTEPIQSVLERIPVQEVLERVPPEVRDRLPASLQPADKHEGRSKLWITLLVLVGVGAAVVLVRRRRAGGGDEFEELDLREAPGEVSFTEGSSAAGLRPTV
jgi:hypothetical protein